LVIKRLNHIIYSWGTALLISLMMVFTIQAKELVLVGSTAADFKPLSLFETRNIFLGYQVKRGDITLTAIRNINDEASYQIFLQKVVHLSARNYERRLMSKTFRTGTATVQASESLTTLKKQLYSNKYSVSVMWLKDVELNDKLKVIQVLWKEST